jgi:hypothetical protein
MRNFHNIEATKFKACDYYVGYGAGLVWHIRRTHQGTWRATLARKEHTIALEARVMSGISYMLDNAADYIAQNEATTWHR